MKTRLLESSDPILITNPTNIRYLTGFVGVAPEEREAYLLIAKGHGFFFTNSLYLEAAKNVKFQMTNDKLEIVEISREKPLARKLAELTYKLKIKTLSFEEDNLTVSEFKKLHKDIPAVALVGTKNIIENIRVIKRDDELKSIQQAAKLTDECFDFILGKIKPGATESELAWEIESFFRKNGAQSAFSPIVAFNGNSSQPHYNVSKNQSVKVSEQDIILLDFGAKVNGYCGDLTRVVFVGKPKEEWKKAYRAVLEAQLAALIYLDSGTSGAEADQIARTTIEKFGFPPYPHSLGHGVGLDIHEAPRLSFKKDYLLKPNMVVSVEPGIYIEGKFGIRIEDLVCIQKKDIEVFSQAPKELLII